MISVTESASMIRIRSHVPALQRLLFFLLGLFPLIAPYELLLEPQWHGYLNVPFVFAASVSAGAMTVSALLIWAAIAGVNSDLQFDKSAGLITYTAVAPVLRSRVTQNRLDTLTRLEVARHDWSDGGPSYSVSAILSDGQSFTSGSSWSREEVEAIVTRVSAFLGR